MKNNLEKIVLGGGCFWCLEAVFQGISGVKKVTSGYAGGTKEKPNYEEVCTGATGHAEVIEIEYNPGEIGLEKILGIFFSVHDPTTLNRQGNDAGTQYRSIILYTTKNQEKIINDYLEKIKKEFRQPVVTEVRNLDKFYPAENYHQRYFEKNTEKAYCQAIIQPKINKIYGHQ